MTTNLWLTVQAPYIYPIKEINSSLLSYSQSSYCRGYLQFNWKDGKSNPADILSKHWEFASIWPILKPLLFWKGDTHELTAKTKGVTEFQLKRFVSITDPNGQRMNQQP